MSAPASFGAIHGRTIIAGSQFSNARITIGGTRDFPQQPQVCRAIHFPRNDDFVQRSALSEQLATLLPPKTDYQSAALWGLDGSGKTQLALQYAHDRCSDPTCSVFWVHANTETSFAQGYKWIATKLGIASDLDGERLLMAVRAHIESLPQWVLVVDNADDLALFGVGRKQKSEWDVATDLSAYIPRGTIGTASTVLWTSRNQRIAGSLVGARRGINVIRMTNAEAETLFQTQAIITVGNGDTEHSDLLPLLDELGWLPRAITQAAAEIRRTKTSIGEYHQMLQQKKKKKVTKRCRILKRSEHDPYRRPEVTNSVLETSNVSMEYTEREHGGPRNDVSHTGNVRQGRENIRGSARTAARRTRRQASRHDREHGGPRDNVLPTREVRRGRENIRGSAGTAAIDTGRQASRHDREHGVPRDDVLPTREVRRGREDIRGSAGSAARDTGRQASRHDREHGVPRDDIPPKGGVRCKGLQAFISTDEPGFST